ncbi:MAG: hypothetical protein ACOYN4_00505 [Bacteroidales bacterium]
MPEGNSFSALIAYFQTLASQHVSIKNFYRFELDEVLSDLRNLETPCLVMEGYKFSFTDNKSDNILKTRGGAFILLDQVKDIGDFNAIHAAWDSLEVIGDDILARIRADKRLPDSPVQSFPIESVEAHLLSNEMGNYYGIRFTFDIVCKFNPDVDVTRWVIPVPEPDPVPDPNPVL